MDKKSIIEIINNLNDEDLKFYQQLLKFFSLFGINENELHEIIELVNFKKEFEDKANKIINDQNLSTKKWTI